jgi:hypothetical protein
MATLMEVRRGLEIFEYYFGEGYKFQDADTGIICAVGTKHQDEEISQEDLDELAGLGWAIDPIRKAWILSIDQGDYQRK